MLEDLEGTDDPITLHLFPDEVVQHVVNYMNDDAIDVELIPPRILLSVLECAIYLDMPNLSDILADVAARYIVTDRIHELSSPVP